MLIRTAVALLVLPFLPLAAPLPQGCGGCGGVGGSGSASGGTCGGLVSISVTVEKGTCKWVTDEHGVAQCRQTKGCKPTITRHWEGLPVLTPLEFCVTLPTGELCLPIPPIVGPSGSGTDTRDSADMSCSNETRSYSVEAPACGLEASADAVCARCSGV